MGKLYLKSNLMLEPKIVESEDKVIMNESTLNDKNNEELTMEKLLKKVEDLGWTVYVDDSCIELGKYSSYGQDFMFTVPNTTSVHNFIEAIFDAAYNYDASYEAYLWLDNTGHGTNGAPYEMLDVCLDMEECEKSMFKLYNDLRDYKALLS